MSNSSDSESDEAQKQMLMALKQKRLANKRLQKERKNVEANALKLKLAMLQKLPRKAKTSPTQEQHELPRNADEETTRKEPPTLSLLKRKLLKLQKQNSAKKQAKEVDIEEGEITPPKAIPEELKEEALQAKKKMTSKESGKKQKEVTEENIIPLENSLESTENRKLLQNALIDLIEELPDQETSSTKSPLPDSLLPDYL